MIHKLNRERVLASLLTHKRTEPQGECRADGWRAEARATRHRGEPHGKTESTSQDPNLDGHRHIITDARGSSDILEPWGKQASPLCLVLGQELTRLIRSEVGELQLHYHCVSAPLQQLDACRLDRACAALVCELVGLRCGLLAVPQS